MSHTPEKMVAITGPSCSGKSTLEQNLALILGDNLAIFPFDDMFVGMPALEGVEVLDWEGPEVWRIDEYTEHVRNLKAGKTVTFDANSRKSVREGVSRRTVYPRQVVVISGFLALYPEAVREAFDTKIYLEIPDEEIIRRRKARAEPQNPWDAEEYIEGPLLEGNRRYVVPQKEFADYLVDGTLPQEELAQVVARIILNNAETKQG